MAQDVQPQLVRVQYARVLVTDRYATTVTCRNAPENRFEDIRTVVESVTRTVAPLTPLAQIAIAIQDTLRKTGFDCTTAEVNMNGNGMLESLEPPTAQ